MGYAFVYDLSFQGHVVIERYDFAPWEGIKCNSLL